MTGKIPNLEPNIRQFRQEKILLVYWSNFHQRYIAKRWPSGNGGDTPKRAASRKSFTTSTQLIKLAPGQERDAADALAVNTPFLQRDLLMKASFGNLYDLTETNGQTWIGITVASPTIQALLDSISTAQGSMLVRTPDGWLALLAGTAQQVITIDPITGLPVWDDPPIAGGGEGGGWQFVVANNATSPSTDSHNAASQGIVVKPDINIGLIELSSRLTTVSGATYRYGIAPFNPATGMVTAAPSYTEPKQVATGSAGQWLRADFGEVVSLLGGDSYLIFVQRVDATASTALVHNEIGSAGFSSPGIQVNGGSGASWYIASFSPGISDAWTSFSDVLQFAMRYVTDTASMPSNIQLMLDSVDNTPGALLTRGSGGWIGVDIGAPGSVLQANGTGDAVEYSSTPLGTAAFDNASAFDINGAAAAAQVAAEAYADTGDASVTAYANLTFPTIAAAYQAALRAALLAG